MEKNLVHYMVDFTLPKDLNEEFVSLIPQQRSMVNRMMEAGQILNYALSLENAKLWVVFAAPSEADLMELIDGLPLSPYMKARVSELTFYNAAHPFVPVFSVN